MNIKPRFDQNDSESLEAEYEALFNEHFTRLFNILLRVSGDPHEAEDIAVEAFWRLWQHGLRRLDNPAGWLYRVGTRLSYNALRDRRRRLTREQRVAADLLLPASQPAPITAVEQRQQREQVRRVLAELPLKQAQVLVLRSSGFSYQEIAAAVGVAPNSIGTLLARAEKAFARRYGEGDEDASF